MKKKYKTNTKKVRRLFHNVQVSSGYGSTTDDSDGSPLRGPRYLPVYDTMFSGTTSKLESEIEGNHDDSDHDDHEEGLDEYDMNVDEVKNIPIHYKAIALSRQVTWNLPPTPTREGQSRLSTNNSDPYLESHRQKRLRFRVKLFSVILLAAAALLTLRSRDHNRDNQYFKPTKELISEIPFPPTSRALHNEEGSPDNLFDMNLFTSEMMKNLLPFPTGAFWTNFVLKPPIDETWNRNVKQESNLVQSSLSDPIVVYPYAFKWSQEVLALSYPSFRRIVQPLIIQDVFWPDISLSATEGIISRKITYFDELSVTIRMASPNGSADVNDLSYFDTFMVQGSPYITSKFQKSTPILTALSVWDQVGCVSIEAEQQGLCATKLENGDNRLSVTGVQFLITQSEGQQWILFVNGGIPVTFYLSSDRRNIVAAKPVTGVLRIAVIPPGAVLGGETVKELLNHSGVYPVASKILINYDDNDKVEPDTAKVYFSFDTVNGNLHSNIDLLMLALPHHKNALVNSDATLPEFDTNYSCIKGTMIPVVGDKWTAHIETLFDEGLPSQMNISNIDAIDIIKSNVEIDRKLVLTPACDVYEFGKQIARMAQLAHIAHNLKMNKSVLDNIVNKVYSHLSNWFDGNEFDEFVFDIDLGGIVSKNSLQNPFADDGNGWYNNHHFQYGYFIYAAAIVSQFKPSFVKEYTNHVSTLIYDIANSSPASFSSVVASTHSDEPKKDLHQLFPSARHKAWYDGHSWASGLFQVSNGKNQESSSEAVNAYYATYLWNKINGSKEKMNYARLLLATEIRSAKTYWHTGPSNTLYPPIFANNYMIGNMGGLDASSTSTLGSDITYVHLINLFPLTEITNHLFSKEFVEGEYAFLEPYISETGASWLGYLTALHGIINPEKAWENAQLLYNNKMDSALSKSQVLYSIASKLGMRTANVTESDNDII